MLKNKKKIDLEFYKPGLNLKCGINVLNIVKSLVLLKFKEIPLDKIKEKYSLNDSEINYLKNFTVSKLNILKTVK